MNQRSYKWNKTLCLYKPCVGIFTAAVFLSPKCENDWNVPQPKVVLTDSVTTLWYLQYFQQ